MVRMATAAILSGKAMNASAASITLGGRFNQGVQYKGLHEVAMKVFGHFTKQIHN